jgi:hypothetical protein
MTKGLYWAMTFTFALSFSLLPPVVFATNLDFLSEVKDQVTYFQFIMLITYNLGDFMGRWAGNVRCLLIKRQATLIGVYCRVVFFATFIPIMFETQPRWLFGADWFKLTNIWMLGVTNGYFSTIAALLAPAHVPYEMRQ